MNNDFNSRGEYQAAPDGCAFDFETASEGFLVSGNTFYRSWGAGVMVFGHSSSSTGFRIVNNTFAYDGCVQMLGDHGAVALMCPNGHRPGGIIAGNTFTTCPGADHPAIYVNPAVPHCGEHVAIANNSIDSEGVVEMPQLVVIPPPPSSAALRGSFPVRAHTPTKAAVLRYTLDGSRPTEGSPVLPASGVVITWPGPALAINVRAFGGPGSLLRPSVTNGFILERNYVMGRMAPQPAAPDVAGALDRVAVPAIGQPLSIWGWAVDTALAGDGLAPVVVVVHIDFEPVTAVLANQPRPDLPHAGVAPNADHGFGPISLPSALSTGNHTIQVLAIGSPSTQVPYELAGSPHCICGGAHCPC